MLASQQRAGKQLKDESRLSTISSLQKRIDKQQQSSKLRRQKTLSKRRKTTGDKNVTNTTFEEDLKRIMYSENGRQYLTNLVSEMDHPKHAVRIKALKTVRTILSLSVQEEEQQQEDIITLSLSIPSFLSTISKHLCCPNNESQLEAAWCITNIASSTHEHTRAIVPYSLQLIQYLENAEPIVQEQCAWALGNIAGDSGEFAMLLIKNGVLKPLSNLLLLRIPDLVKTSLWCLSNIVRGVASLSSKQSKQPFDLSLFFQPDFNFAASLIKHLKSENEGVAVESAWTLSYLTSADYNYVTHLLQLNLLEPVISILAKNDSNQMLQLRMAITLPVLRILGAVARGPDTVIESILACENANKLLSSLMIQTKYSADPAIQKETVWVLSNLAAGTARCVDMIASAGFIPVLLDLCSRTNASERFEYELKREAIYTMINVCSDVRLMDMAIISSMMTGISHVLSQLMQQSIHEQSDEQFVIVCLNFVIFVLQVISSQIDQEKQEQVKKLIPFSVIQQFHQKFSSSHQTYQQLCHRIMQ